MSITQPQVTAILDHVGEGIQELHRFRAFVKERSQIEKDYAQKLENLAKKYTKKLDAEDNVAESSCTRAWHIMVSETSLIAKCHQRLAEDLGVSLVDTIKATAARKEEARKKHAAFFQKLKAEREKSCAEKDKAKISYDEACLHIQNTRNKYLKGDQDKVKKQLDQAILDCNNKKNIYLLALGAANAEREKFFEEDLPTFADQLQDLDWSRISALQNIYRKYIEMESEAKAAVQTHYSEILVAVEQMDAGADAQDSVLRVTRLSSLQQDDNWPMAFIPWTGDHTEIMIDTSSNLAVDEASAIFLNNKLLKDRRTLDHIGNELSRDSARMKELEQAVSSIAEKGSAEYDDARERLLDIYRKIALLSTEKARVKSAVDMIIQNIGGSGLDAESHDFKPSSFTIPTVCDHCRSTIWGLSNKGFTCKSCGFNCHAKCEMNVPPNCSHKRGKINRYQPPSPTTTQDTMSMMAQQSQDTAPSPPAENLQLPTARVLYDYMAQSTDELTIVENEVVQVVDAEDNSGWIKVQRDGQTGLVPASYISFDLEPESDNVAVTNDDGEKPNDSGSFYVEVLYDFEAVNADELELRKGDRILVTKMDDNGWWEGTINGRTGVFPANYVQY